MAKRKSQEKPLRFGVLIRVSTEQQAKRGESLCTQTKQIKQAVESLGGEVIKEYKGNQHATAGFEHKLVEDMLADASKKRKPFDAIMIADPSRWSRDNASSKAGLETLRETGIRFFVLTTEYDLHEPTARFYLGMSAEIGEYQAQIQKQKSLNSKIERARRGLPSCGRLPFGRTFDKKTEKWGVDSDKHAMIKDCAKRYLAGESIKNLAKEYGTNNVTLHEVLTLKSGDIWVQEFRADDLNIHEKVKISIPRLLPDQTIKAILKRCKHNRTYVRGKNKYKYLLSGKVFCSVCGRTLSPKNTNGNRYYSPSEVCHCLDGFVRADDLEQVVAAQLFDMMGRPDLMREAIEAAMPNKAREKQQLARIPLIDEELAKISKARTSILNLIERGSLSEDEAAKKLAEMKEREHRFEDEKEQIHSELQHIPDAQSINRFCKRFNRPRAGSTRRDIALRLRDFEKMTWDDKRQMVLRVFDGETPQGQPMGVYIESTPGQTKWQKRRPWLYKIRGIFNVDIGAHTWLNPSVFLESPEQDKFPNELSSYSQPLSIWILPFLLSGVTRLRNQQHKKPPRQSTGRL